MPDDSSIEDLRRRLRRDPASIAFAQLAEELRRAGQFRDAASVCQRGLAIYPEYLSARVTLGRALLELARFDEAQRELETVLETAPEHLAATRALADVLSRRTSKAKVDALTTADGRGRRGTVRILAALEAWLVAIHVTRARQSA